MLRPTDVLSMVLALGFIGSGTAKRLGLGRSSTVRDRLDIGDQLWRSIGKLEVVGAVGLLFGLAVPWIGLATAVGLMGLLVVGISAHLLVDDLRHARTHGAWLVLVIVQAVLFSLPG
jgi:uncharacterized membrane protein YphA (DoxX/SURF4 family)